MSIPLVRNNTKDAINTSIIAIKKNLERINTLLGLVDSSEPNLSGFATKQELEDTVTEINNTIDEVETSLQPVDTVTSGNMYSVTSNAVYASVPEIINIDTYTKAYKFPNGLMIATKIVSATIANWTAWGNMYISQDISIGSFGVTFVNFLPAIMITPRSQSKAGFVVYSHDQTLTDGGKFQVGRATTSLSDTYSFSVVAIGSWK